MAEIQLDVLDIQARVSTPHIVKIIKAGKERTL